MARLIPLGIVSTVCAIASVAGAAIRLPLEGYYRAGRFMPVMIESGDAITELLADGALTTEVAKGRTATVPLLMLGVSVPSVQNVPLHVLGANDRLVGFTGNESGVAAQLFPGQICIPVRIDPTVLLSGPTIAWESLDAIVLENPIESKRTSELLAAGITIAIRLAAPPDSTWPWQRVGEYWVLRHEPAGPLGSIEGEAVYVPLQAWQPGQAAHLRRQVVLVAIAMSLAMISTLLIRRPRQSLIAMIIVALLCAAVVEVWRRQQPSVRSAEGSVVVAQNGLLQTDQWQFEVASASGSGIQSVAADRPVLVDELQADRLHLRARCDTQGNLSWQFELPSGSALALLSRRLDRAEPMEATTSTSRRSPLNDLARRVYLRSGLRIVGEISEDEADRWPGVLLVGTSGPADRR
jgi:type II secretory pathway pseudopilin PulG